MFKKDFDVQCAAKVNCTYKKKIEIVRKAIALMLNVIIAHLRYMFKQLLLITTYYLSSKKGIKNVFKESV